MRALAPSSSPQTLERWRNTHVKNLSEGKRTIRELVELVERAEEGETSCQRRGSGKKEWEEKGEN